MSGYTVVPIEGLPEIQPGMDLAQLLVDASPGLVHGDVLVVAQKVVSKVEGRFAETVDRAEVIASESNRVLRRLGGMVISETRHGFICANAGVDASNVPGDRVLLLPIDPDLSARRLRAQVAHLAGVDVGVVIADTFGRAWRLGQTNVAIGVAGIEAFRDHVGEVDTQGLELHATRICVADQLAGAAELVMRKTTGVCAALIRGAVLDRGPGSARQIVRPPEDDLFR